MSFEFPENNGETPKKTLENKAESIERIPTEAEVWAVLEKLIGEKEISKFTDRRKESDEKGLYLWEIECPTEDGHVEYMYIRKGSHPVGGSSSETVIHIAVFDTDEFPINGTRVAELRDGEWSL
jgi:hypothetical protein